MEKDTNVAELKKSVAENIKHELKIADSIPFFDNWKQAIQAVIAEEKSDNYLSSAERDVFIPKDWEQALTMLGRAMRDLVLSKQNKYGKENILEFREQGLVIRMNDKQKRLKHGSFPTPTHGTEQYIEDFGDMIGYGVLGLMLELGWIDADIPLMEG